MRFSGVPTVSRSSRFLPGSALLAALAFALPPSSSAQTTKADVAAFLDGHMAQLSGVADQIWGFAEIGYRETKSSALLERELEDAGFTVRRGVAGIPTAFVASRGSGKPVIAVLGEFDALPGINQDSVPTRAPVEGKASAHACGHNLLGTASLGAVFAVAQWLKSTGRPGTIRYYGTPAEEGGSGKVYMVRAGLFDDVDAVLTWHPGDRNDASPGSNLAVISAKFRFHGVSAHAAAAPDRGRSALDGVEVFDYMANMMREHVPQETRIHYVITNGGGAPNVVPDFAEVYYFVRHPDADMARSIFERLVAAAEGAAKGTGTTMDYEVTGGSYADLSLSSLQQVVYANLKQVGGVTYDVREQKFAEVLKQTLPAKPTLSAAAEIQPFAWHQTYASSDAGDVSWNVPMSSLNTATWVPGTAAHSWQAVSTGGMSIGDKGMLVAAKTLAFTAMDLFTDPAKLAAARAEFDKKRGPGFKYVPLLGDRKPPLDLAGSDKN
jgi:aminobenzoyl-glutamate utilization protein B